MSEVPEWTEAKENQFKASLRAAIRMSMLEESVVLECNGYFFIEIGKRSYGPFMSIYEATSFWIEN